MKTMFAVLLVALSACASPRPVAPKSLACQTTPQWFVNDAKGLPSRAVYVCFGDDGNLLWQARPLTLDEMQKMTAEARPEPKPITPHEPLKVDPKKPIHWNVPLPTLGGVVR